MIDDFDSLPADQKIARLRSGLELFGEVQHSQDKKLITLSANVVVVGAALIGVLAKLAHASGDPECFVMNTEKLLADALETLAGSNGTVTAEYESAVKNLFELVRRVADPSEDRTRKPN